MDLITISHEKDLVFKSELRNHTIFSDYAIEDGGKDEAPSPADYLVCSLGSCFGMIIERYCQSHGYSSDGTEISMTYMLNDKPKMVKSITADIELPEDFPEDRKKAILHSVKTCVIYNSLNKEIDIDIEID